MKSIASETLAIGDELLSGKTTDTNSNFVANELRELGITLARTTVICDNDQEILENLEACSKRVPFVFVFGGLGPTSDDRTVAVVCSWLGVSSVYDSAAVARVKGHYEKLGREVTETALQQARIPAGVKSFNNPVGAAAGFSFIKNGCELFFFPGVPQEMKAILQSQVIPYLRQKLESLGAEKTRSISWRLMGVFESALQELLFQEEVDLPKMGFRIGYRVMSPEVELVVYGSMENANWNEVTQRIENKIKPYFYSHDQTLEKTLVSMLIAKGLTFSVVESCTGGFLCQRVTRVPGASASIWGGIIAYQHDAKNKFFDLGLNSDEQAVGLDVTLKLCKLGRQKFGTDICVSITGYMDFAPEFLIDNLGNTKTENVGQFFVGIDSLHKSYVKEFRIRQRERSEMQWSVTSFALKEVLDSLIS